MGTFVMLLLIGLGISTVIAVWVIRRGAAKAQASGYSADRIETPDTTETRVAIDRWAQVHGYERGDGDGTSVLRYQKHVGGSKGQPTFLDVHPGNGVLVLESYVGLIHPFTRKLLQGQMPLGAPGLTLALARKTAKKDHNALRAELGLPLIA